MPWQGPRRDSGFGVQVPLVSCSQLVHLLFAEQSTALDGNSEIESVRVQSPRRMCQKGVTDDQGRRLVFLRQVESTLTGLKALLDRTRSKHDTRELTLRSIDDK